MTVRLQRGDRFLCGMASHFKRTAAGLERVVHLVDVQITLYFVDFHND